jgi:hypothetical protein
MADRALDRRSLGWVLLLALAVLGGTRVAQGAIYQAYGFNARELLINAGAFGVLAATCSALVVDRGIKRIARWGALGGAIWVVAAALRVWLDADTALVGALSAMGTSASVLGDSRRVARQRIMICSGLALVAAIVAAVMARGVRVP